MEVEAQEVKKLGKPRSAKTASKRAYRAIFQAWPEIIEKCVEEAASGSLPHAKFLAEWAELESPVAMVQEEATEDAVEEEGEGDGDPILAKLFLETFAEMKAETD